MSDLNPVNHIMTDKPKHKTTIAEGVEKGKKAAEVVKEFTPPAVDGIIDQGEQLATVGVGIFGMLKSMFNRKKK